MLKFVGAVFYRGPSLVTGDAILGIVTGLEAPSLNVKTGPMVQAWVLRADRTPMAAKRANLDDAVCGDCRWKGRDGFDSACYVTVWNGPRIVWEHRDDYIDASLKE